MVRNKCETTTYDPCGHGASEPPYDVQVQMMALLLSRFLRSSWINILHDDLMILMGRSGEISRVATFNMVGDRRRPGRSYASHMLVMRTNT